MNRAKWDWRDYGTIDGVVVNGGAGNATQMEISAREIARFGHLILNRGRWHANQLISESWIEESTTPQVPKTLPLATCAYSNIDGRGIYGYGWWTNADLTDIRYDATCNAFTSPGQRMWPDAPVGTHALVGFNNNRLFVIPEWNMVVVRRS